MSYYVYSTLPASVKLNGVFIEGGTGLIYVENNRIFKKEPACTCLTDDQFNIIKDYPEFDYWVKEGFLTFLKRKVKKPESVIDDMSLENVKLQDPVDEANLTVEETDGLINGVKVAR